MTPLDGVRVLDLSWYAPGPFCSLVCARLGAEVVKVEPLSGDPLRGLDPEAFARLNAGKKSLCLDLKAAEGREALLALAADADVLVEGFRPGVADRLGVGYTDVASAAPAIVYASIAGYAPSGPYRERAGHDVNYMALAGTLHGARSPLPLQVADLAAGGLYAVTGILAALLERSTSGRGRHLELSMHAGLFAMSPLAEGEVADRLSGRYPSYTLYETRDGEALSVGALEPKFWERFCRALGREDWIGRARDETARDEVAAVVAERDLGDWEALFRDVDACVEPVLSPAAARERAGELLGGPVDSGWPFSAPGSSSQGSPRLGEHTQALLVETGLTPEAVAALREKGVC